MFTPLTESLDIYRDRSRDGGDMTMQPHSSILTFVSLLLPSIAVSAQTGVHVFNDAVIAASNGWYQVPGTYDGANSSQRDAGAQVNSADIAGWPGGSASASAGILSGFGQSALTGGLLQSSASPGGPDPGYFANSAKATTTFWFKIKNPDPLASSTVTAVVYISNYGIENGPTSHPIFNPTISNTSYRLGAYLWGVSESSYAFKPLISEGCSNDVSLLGGSYVQTCGIATAAPGATISGGDATGYAVLKLDVLYRVLASAASLGFQESGQSQLSYRMELSTLPGAGYSFVLQAPPIPEPASWSMLLLGFAAVGAIARARRQATIPTL